MATAETTDGFTTDPGGPAPLAPAARRPGYRGEIALVGACLTGGVALGALWALVGAVVVHGTEGAEKAAASDSVFCLLGLVVGLVSALLLAVLPGHRPVLRAGVALGGSLLGGFVGLAVGLLLGTAPLRADGLVLSWPIALGTVTTLRLLVVHLLGRE